MSLPDWKGLLKWSLSHTDPNEPGDVKPMSEEDKKFLENAMSSLHEHEKEVFNSISQINEISRHFSVNGKEPSSLPESSKESLLKALGKLEEHFEDHPSNASSVVRLCLLDSFTLLLKSTDKDVLSSTLSIISCAFSNNMSVLEEAGNSQLVPTLLNLRTFLGGSDLEPKLISAISSSIRNCRKAEEAFVSMEGLTYLRDCLSSDNLKTRERSVLLLNHFVSLDLVGRLIVATLDPYRMMKQLLPVDPANHGIQFSELSATLCDLLTKKHKNILTKEEVEDLANVLDRQLAQLSSLKNPDYAPIEKLLRNARSNCN